MTLSKRIWEKVGYLFIYSVLTISIHCFLIFLNLIPPDWWILQTALLTSSITLFAVLMRRIVK